VKSKKKSRTPKEQHNFASPDCDFDEIWKSPGSRIEKYNIFGMKYYFEFRYVCPKCGWKSEKIRERYI
jgi:predicted RNA-binding Zn-ribbon protein involved in translation (DUF1610 family)